MNLQRKLGVTMHLVFKEAVALKGPKPQCQNFNFSFVTPIHSFQIQWGEAVI